MINQHHAKKVDRIIQRFSRFPCGEHQIFRMAVDQLMRLVSFYELLGWYLSAACVMRTPYTRSRTLVYAYCPLGP